MTNLNSQVVETLQGIRSEITVDKEGKGSITKSGLCVLLNISRSLLTRSEFSKKLAEKLTPLGFERDRFFNEEYVPDILVSGVIEYYAFDANQISENARTLFRAFAAVGVRAWFQEVTGYEKPKPQTELERAKQAYEYMGKMIAVMEYAADKPGQERINNFAVSPENDAVLPGFLTLEDVLARYDREFNNDERRTMGMYSATAYRNLTGKKPAQTVKRYVDKSGKQQTAHVACYPVDFLPVIENAIELGFMSGVVT